MNGKIRAYLTESLSKVAIDIFDENDIRLLLIEIRDLLGQESFLREVCNFVAHPDRSKGICHSRINSRHAKMKFHAVGTQKLIENQVFENNKEKPWVFFSDQILGYIKTPKIEKNLFEVVIRAGIEEIPDHLLLKYYNLSGRQALDLITKAYKKEAGYYVLSKYIKGKEYLFIDDLLKFVRGTITGDSVFNQSDLEIDLRSGISRIVEQEAILINLKEVFKNLDGIVLCIISILHEASFLLFDNSKAVSFLTIAEKDHPNQKDELLISLHAQADSFSFPIISTSLKASEYILGDSLEIQSYKGKAIPWNIAKRNANNILQLHRS